MNLEQLRCWVNSRVRAKFEEVCRLPPRQKRWYNHADYCFEMWEFEELKKLPKSPERTKMLEDLAKLPNGKVFVPAKRLLDMEKDPKPDPTFEILGLREAR